jgi:hypothetical protein
MAATNFNVPIDRRTAVHHGIGIIPCKASRNIGSPGGPDSRNESPHPIIRQAIVTSQKRVGVSKHISFHSLPRLRTNFRVFTVFFFLRLGMCRKGTLSTEEGCLPLYLPL